jgi:hypothetical protein
LQVLQADKVNRDLRGPGFWKLDPANCEAVQKNLTTDFMRIALTHREENMKLEQHDETVWKLHAEMKAVAEPFVPTTQATEASADKDEEDKELAEPSI